jgi:hypothetical protein
MFNALLDRGRRYDLPVMLSIDNIIIIYYLTDEWLRNATTLLLKKRGVLCHR